MEYRKISESEVTITELMVPTYTNFGGKVHGGYLLSLMDKVAYVCATKHSKAYCVTVAVEGVEFLSPVEVGELLIVKASINYIGNSTMIIGMHIECENPKTGKITHTNSCYFTMLAKDEQGNHLAVPGLLLENEEQLRRFCEAKRLKDFSKQKREMLKSDLLEHTVQQLTEQCSNEKCKIII